MRNSDGKRKRFGLLLICAATLSAVSLPLWSSARSQPVTTAITVVNNSHWEIHHLYLSPVEQDNWGPDQLNETILRTGDSFALHNVSCSGGQIKVISEDQGGCFLSVVVACATDATWTIADNATPDCGN